jgi:Ca-activated chloride channel family protein
MSTKPSCFMPVAAQTGQPVQLSMQRLWLTGRVLAAGGRLLVQHVFRSAEEKPLEVIYCFPLSRDAALRSFRIVGEGFEAHSELRETQEAVKTYEEGIADGSLSVLARQFGDGVVNLTLGNIRPRETVTVVLELLQGVELRDQGFRFRFPFTLAPAYHPRMRATRVFDNQGEIELPTSEFGDLVLPRFREDASSLHQVGFDIAVSHQLPIDELGSPSHSIRVKQEDPAVVRVALAEEKDVPNRDLVLDVSFEEAAVQVLGGPTSDGKRSFAAMIPSTVFGAQENTPRQVVLVLDRSGSMQGVALAQARKAAEACLATLSESDSFGLVAFDDRVESMETSLVSGSGENREKARGFLAGIDARGGTELGQGFLEAARMLQGGGDVLILTDGQVSGTEKILAAAREAHIRLFCLGIGSASQDRFLSLLARETNGISRFVTARERVDVAAIDLFANMGRPVASGLKATPNLNPEPPAVVFAGTPVLLFGELESEAAMELSWDDGRSLRFSAPSGDSETGQTVRLLHGSRLITDWESRYQERGVRGVLERRQQDRVAARLLSLSQKFGLASRAMSLVAVVKRAGDQAGEIPETRVVPVGVPQDVEFASYFGTPPGSHTFAAMPAPSVLEEEACHELSELPERPNWIGRIGSWGKMLSKTQRIDIAAASSEDALLELASKLEPDGGMPGDNPSARIARTIAAVLAFVKEGHTLSSGAFRLHLARLVGFLKSAAGLSQEEQAMVERAITAAAKGRGPSGDWLGLARRSNVALSELTR